MQKWCCNPNKVLNTRGQCIVVYAVRTNDDNIETGTRMFMVAGGTYEMQEKSSQHQIELKATCCIEFSTTIAL